MPELHIRQRDACDCAIATIAAVANLPYESVANINPRKLDKRGLYPREVRKLLQEATQIKWRLPRKVYFRRLRSLCSTEQSLVLFIRRPGNILWQRITGALQHCILIRDGRIFDPEYNEAILANEYDRIQWIPTIAFYPVDAHKLREVQHDNSRRFRTKQLWSEIIGG